MDTFDSIKSGANLVQEGKKVFGKKVFGAAAGATVPSSFPGSQESGPVKSLTSAIYVGKDGFLREAWIDETGKVISEGRINLFGDKMFSFFDD